MLKGVIATAAVGQGSHIVDQAAEDCRMSRQAAWQAVAQTKPTQGSIAHSIPAFKYIAGRALAGGGAHCRCFHASACLRHSAAHARSSSDPNPSTCG